MFYFEKLNCMPEWFLQTVTSVEWHRRGDYLSTVMPSDILFFHMIYIIFVGLFTHMLESIS